MLKVFIYRSKKWAGKGGGVFNLSKINVVARLFIHTVSIFEDNAHMIIFVLIHQPQRLHFGVHELTLVCTETKKISIKKRHTYTNGCKTGFVFAFW